jgi:hypothetical protein
MNLLILLRSKINSVSEMSFDTFIAVIIGIARKNISDFLWLKTNLESHVDMKHFSFKLSRNLRHISIFILFYFTVFDFFFDRSSIAAP